MSAQLNTGFIIHPTASQYFATGPDSGSIVDVSFDVSLYESASSFVRLNSTNFYYRIYNPEECELTKVCGPGKILTVFTGSGDGEYVVYYATGSASAVSSSIQVSGFPNFNNAFNFAQIEQYDFEPSVNVAGSGSYFIPSSSVISDKVYFRYINYCE